jgi:hypothetical protein
MTGGCQVSGRKCLFGCEERLETSLGPAIWRANVKPKIEGKINRLAHAFDCGMAQQKTQEWLFERRLGNCSIRFRLCFTHGFQQCGDLRLNFLRGPNNEEPAWAVEPDYRLIEALAPC